MMWRFSVAAMTAAVLCLTTLAGAEGIEKFQFIQISDTHFSGKPDSHSAGLKKAFADMKANFPDAAFIINCGDITEMGYKEQYAQYNEMKKEFGKPVYGTIGNHDVRWSENGKENYRDAFGDPYKTFDYNGVRFVTMDASMLLEQYAHFDGEKMARLDKDMKALSNGMPMFISFHHPILAGGGFADNEFVFAEAIRPYNVPLVMNGHGHGLTVTRANDTTYAMGGSTFGACAYRVWTVDGDSVKGQVRFFEKNETKDDVTISLKKPASSGTETLEVSSVVPDTNKVLFKLASDGVTSATEVTYAVDGTYKGGAKFDAGAGTWSTGEHPRMPVGLHEFVVKFNNRAGVPQMRMKTFTTAAKNGAAPVLETTVLKLGSGAQSSPAIDGNCLYVGCNDGKLYCFDLQTNKEKWTADLKREVVAAPVVQEGKVYVGGLDKNVYCLDAQNGQVVWKSPVGGAVLGSALVTGKFVICGSGDGAVHCLNIKTGKEVWKYQTAKFVKMKPALADNGKAIIFGGWDNQNVKLDIETGKKLWSVQAARAGGLSCATADIAVCDGVAIADSHDYQVNGYDVATGQKLWNWTPPAKRNGPSYSSPAVDNGVSYAGTIDGKLLGLDVKTGKAVLDLELRDGVGKSDAVFDSSPLIADGKLYVGTVGGNLYCVDLAAKKVLWSVAMQPGFILTRPAAKDGKIYVSSMNNAVYIIDTKSAAAK